MLLEAIHQLLESRCRQPFSFLSDTFSETVSGSVKLRLDVLP